MPKDFNGVEIEVGQQIKNLFDPSNTLVVTNVTEREVGYVDTRGHGYVAVPGDVRVVIDPGPKTGDDNTIVIDRSELPKVTEDGRLPAENYTGAPSGNKERASRLRAEALSKLALSEFYLRKEDVRQKRIEALTADLKYHFGTTSDVAAALVDKGWRNN